MDLWDHAEYKGHCWDWDNSNHQAMEMMRHHVESHGIHVSHGQCHGHMVHQWHKDGWTVREFGHGESMGDITADDFWAHADWKGHCWDWAKSQTPGPWPLPGPCSWSFSYGIPWP